MQGRDTACDTCCETDPRMVRAPAFNTVANPASPQFTIAPTTARIRGTSCQCDDRCMVYNDCCPDYGKYCLASTSTTTTTATTPTSSSTTAGATSIAACPVANAGMFAVPQSSVRLVHIKVLHTENELSREECAGACVIMHCTGFNYRSDVSRCELVDSLDAESRMPTLGIARKWAYFHRTNFACMHVPSVGVRGADDTSPSANAWCPLRAIDYYVVHAQEKRSGGGGEELRCIAVEKHAGSFPPDLLLRLDSCDVS